MKVTAVFASLLLVSATAADRKSNVQRLRSDSVGRKLGKPTSGPPGQSGSAPGQSKASKNAKAEAPKVKICHHEKEDSCPYKTLEISANALWGHMNNHENDELGTCEDLCVGVRQIYDSDTCTCYSEDESMSMSMSASISLSMSASVSLSMSS